MATANGEETTYILVTGANAGLGLSICQRIINEFLLSRPSSQSLHLIITTRTRGKSTATLSALRTHLDRDAFSKAESHRVSLSAHELDLCALPTVLSTASAIDAAYPYLNAIILNAGIMGVEGIKWFQAVMDVLRHPIAAVTWPDFNKHSLRALAGKQLQILGGSGKVLGKSPDNEQDPDPDPEPPLGQIFTANVFGHYLLVSHLSRLLSSPPSPRDAGPSRIIWVSSIETSASSFSLSDLQCLDRRQAYSSSKRLTDLLALTSHLPSTAPSVHTFLPSHSQSRPKQYLSHPGVVGTDIVPLPTPIRMAKELAFYIARWVGSPWHTISSYKGAASAAWLALVPATALEAMEERDGKAKWGSATDRLGNERVRRSEVEGWGFGGRVGEERRYGGAGRRSGAVDLTGEERERFEELGGQAWSAMERLRGEWEGRLRGGAGMGE